MDKLDTLYNEGKNLMEQALDCYSKNKINEAENYRNKANDVFDKANKLYCIENTDRDLLYGKNRNFGICYHIFEDCLLKNMKSRKGQKFINEVSNLIKSNKVLKEQFDVYNNICNKKTVGDASDYVNGIVECVANMGFKKDEIKKANDKLIDLVETNSNVNKLLEIDDEILKLYEEIDFILSNKKSINNIDDYNKIKKSLVEHFEKNNAKNISDENVNESYEQSLEKIIEKYGDLTDDEIKLVETILSAETDKLSLFEQYKTDTLDMINETIKSADEDEKEQWSNIKESLSDKKYNEKTLVDDILNFTEIKETLNE